MKKTQIFKPPKPTRHHNSIELWILLSLRAHLLCILQYEALCSAKDDEKHLVSLKLVMPDKTDLCLPIGHIHAATSKPGNGNVGWILVLRNQVSYRERKLTEL